MKSTVPLFVLLFALSISSCSFDPISIETSGIYGNVYDVQTGQALQGAQVSINGPDAGSELSDWNGNYRFENIREGNYSVTAQLGGYEIFRGDAIIALGEYGQVNIPLERISMLSTQDVFFTSSNDEVDIVFTNLTNIDVELEVEEDAAWIFTDYYRFDIQPGESKIITLKANPILGANEAAVVVNVVNAEMFNDDIIESYTIRVRR